MVTPGAILDLLVQYWYVTLFLLMGIVGTIVFLLIRKRSTKHIRQEKKLINAVIFDDDIRSAVTTVQIDEIRDSNRLRPSIIKGKRIYLLQPTLRVISVVNKPSGNGEHEEHAKEKAAVGKRKAK